MCSDGGGALFSALKAFSNPPALSIILLADNIVEDKLSEQGLLFAIKSH